jgi:ABC-2 type transport system ATP-binding protein
MRPELTVRETMDLYAGYYRNPRSVEETIEQVGLAEKLRSTVGKLSGGQQRRLDVALALIGDPELIFLDEPTTGFDPAARRRAWDVIGSLRGLGKTVFLTTHYMEEAQALADRVAIIVGGEVVAEGAPAELGQHEDAAALIRFRLPEGVSAGDLPAIAAAAEGVNGDLIMRTESPVEALNELTGWALAHGVDLEGLEVRRPTLEDVYLRVTGVSGGAREEPEQR